jgi:hypothetical protein
LSGQHPHPLRVVAFNTIEGWAGDVSADIARHVLSCARELEHELPRCATSWSGRVREKPRDGLVLPEPGLEDTASHTPFLAIDPLYVMAAFIMFALLGVVFFLRQRCVLGGRSHAVRLSCGFQKNPE